MKTAMEAVPEQGRASPPEKGPLERLFTGNATARLLDFMIANQLFDYSESDMARLSGVSLRHVQTVADRTVALGLLQRTRTSGRAKMYKLDKAKAGGIMEKLALTLAGAEISNHAEETHSPEINTPARVASLLGAAMAPGAAAESSAASLLDSVKPIRMGTVELTECAAKEAIRAAITAPLEETSDVGVDLDHKESLRKRRRELVERRQQKAAGAQTTTA